MHAYESLASRPEGEAAMKRPVESTQDFKLLIAAIIGDKPKRIAGARKRRTHVTEQR
jgi:hypothetical protein